MKEHIITKICKYWVIGRLWKAHHYKDFKKCHSDENCPVSDIWMLVQMCIRAQCWQWRNFIIGSPASLMGCLWFWVVTTIIMVSCGKNKLFCDIWIFLNKEVFYSFHFHYSWKQRKHKNITPSIFKFYTSSRFKDVFF